MKFSPMRTRSRGSGSSEDTSAGRLQHHTVHAGLAPPRGCIMGLRRPPHTLEDGAESFRLPIAPPADDMYMHPQFTFGVAFAKGEIFESEPIIATLHQLSGLV